MSDVIVLIPDHCLSIYLLMQNCLITYGSHVCPYTSDTLAGRVQYTCPVVPLCTVDASLSQ